MSASAGSWSPTLFLRSAVIIAGLGAAAPAAAETISYAEAARFLAATCGADISTYCKGVRPGSGRLQDCLSANVDKVSQQCQRNYVAVFESLAARAKAQANAPALCESDAERLCENFRAGQARILRCLTRSDNVRKVTRKCNQAITDAGWR
jgi:hypothetical protein